MNDEEEGDGAAPAATVPLKKLPDAMEAMVYVQSRWPLIVDTTGQATRFLRYQPGNFLSGMSPKDMA